MADRVRACDWASTALGAVEHWPQSLRITVDLMLHHGFPMCVLWGQERVTLYNDAYRPLLGDKHPALLGRPLYDVWPEIREHNERVTGPAWSGETITLRDAPYRIVGEPVFGNAWFDATISPVCTEADGVEGIVITSIETSDRVLSQRRLRASEERYRAFVNASTDVVYRMSPDWTLMRQLDGRGFVIDTPETRDDWMERYILPEDRDGLRQAVKRAIDARGRFELEHRIVRADGTVGWTMSRAMPVLDEEGEIVEWLGTARDVTDKRLAENALRTSEQRYRALFESIDEGMCVIEMLFDDEGAPSDYRFLQVNPAFERETGLADAVGKTVRQLVPEHEAHWFEIYGRIAKTGEPARFEYEAAALGRLYDVYAFRIDAPELHRVAILFRDVLPRRKVEAALRENEERKTFLLQLGDTLRPLADPRLLAEAACRLLAAHLDASGGRLEAMAGGPGRETAEVVGEHIRDGPPLPGGFPLAAHGDLLREGRILVLPDVQADAVPGDAACPADARLAAISIPLMRDGRLAAVLTVHDRAPRDWQEREIEAVRDAAERTWFAFERARAEMALSQSEQRLQRVLETDAVAVLFFKPDGALIGANDVFLAMTGYTREDIDARALRWQALTPPEFHAASRAQMDMFAETGRIGPYEKQYLRRDGSRIWMLFAGRDLGDGTIVEFGVSIDDRKRAEEALKASEERMAKDLADIQALQTAGAAIIDDSREEEAEDAILSAAVSIMRSDAASLQMVDPVSGDLVLLRHIGFHPEAAAFWTRVTHAGAGTCGRAFKHRARTIVEDVLQDETIRDSEDLHYFRLSGIVAMQTTPLVTRSGQLIGMMSTHWGRPHRPAEREFGHFNVLARQAADLIERRHAEAARSRSEERLRQFGEASQDVLWIRDAETFQWEYLTPAFETIYGLDRATALSGDNMAGWAELILPEDRERAVENVRRVREGEWVTFEYRIRRPSDGQVRWLRNTDFPIKDRDGRVARIGGIGHDITAMKEIQEALAAAERRQRLLVEGIPQQVWRATDNGCWTWASPQWTEYTGQSLQDSQGWGWLEALHPKDRIAARANWSTAMATGGFELEYRICQAATGKYRWFHTRASPVRDGKGVIVEWLGTSTDIDDLRRLQERQVVLMAELQHRTRNLMTLILAIAEKTGRASKDLADFRARFSDRLGALARVQGLLSRLREDDRVSFDELIESQLAAMQANRDNVTLKGPSGVRLRSSMVQTLSLALHELATNAVKYGALGQPDGKLGVTWSLQERGIGEPPWLDIEWCESNVEMPADSAPKGGGQGRELIERALPYQLGARTTYQLRQDGVRCTISLPVSTHPTAAETEDD